MQVPTHYYKSVVSKRYKFVTLETKKDRLVTSDGVWADTIEDLKSVEELLGKEVEYEGATGVLVGFHSDQDVPERGKYAYTTEKGFMVHLDKPGLTAFNELVRVSWKTLTSQKTLLPTWVPFHKLKLK